MTAQQFLAQLYVDDELRRVFLADPLGAARRAGFDGAAADALAAIDPEALTLAARSFARKRSARETGPTRLTAFFTRRDRP